MLSASHMTTARALRWTCVIAALVLAHVLLDTTRRHRPSTVDALIDAPAVPSAVTRRLALGFSSAAADVQFLAAIQLFGDRTYLHSPTAERARRSLALHRLLEYATDLDPNFEYAYVFGASSIPISLSDGSILNVDKAIALLEKGTAQGGSDWRIPFHLAYLLQSVIGDFERAAVAMAEAARRPGRPAYVPLLATRLAAAGGSIETGLTFTHAMLANAESDEQRNELQQRVLLLEMERGLRVIEAAAAAFKAREGRWPSDLEELQRSALLPEIGAEPHGGRYLFDPAAGVAKSTGAERLKLSKLVVEELERTRRANQAAKPTVAETTTP